MDKKRPKPPIFPPKDVKIGKDFCLFHKGKIQGEIYICPKCSTQYCKTCAVKAKENGKKCVKCKNPIYL